MSANHPLFVITGTGHSGTGWASKFFNELGYNCGHEKYLRYDGYRGLPSSDSSWMAMGHLRHLSDVPMIHLVRNPLDVVRSFLRSGTYLTLDTTSKHTQYTYRVLPALTWDDELGRCIIRATMWDLAMKERPNTLRVRIEDMHLGKKEAVRTAVKMVKYATGDKQPRVNVRDALAKLGTNINAHHRDVYSDVSWADIITHPLGNLMICRARLHGYEIST